MDHGRLRSRRTCVSLVFHHGSAAVTHPRWTGPVPGGVRAGWGARAGGTEAEATAPRRCPAAPRLAVALPQASRRTCFCLLRSTRGRPGSTTRAARSSVTPTMRWCTPAPRRKRNGSWPHCGPGWPGSVWNCIRTRPGSRTAGTVYGRDGNRRGRFPVPELGHTVRPKCFAHRTWATPAGARPGTTRAVWRETVTCGSVGARGEIPPGDPTARPFSGSSPPVPAERRQGARRARPGGPVQSSSFEGAFLVCTNSTAAPPTTTSAMAVPTMTGVAGEAPVAARLSSMPVLPAEKALG